LPYCGRIVLDMKQQLPSDTLKKPTRRVPWILGVTAGLALAGSAVAFGPSIASTLNPAPTPTPTATQYVATMTADELDSVQSAADQQAATIKDDEEKAAAAAKAAALAAAHQQQADDGPIKCATGYKANAVDAAGNESNCVKNGPAGTPCVAYDSDNNCTQYYKP
jgi:hypothetical protein